MDDPRYGQTTDRFGRVSGTYQQGPSVATSIPAPPPGPVSAIVGRGVNAVTGAGAPPVAQAPGTTVAAPVPYGPTPSAAVLPRANDASRVVSDLTGGVNALTRAGAPPVAMATGQPVPAAPAPYGPTPMSVVPQRQPMVSQFMDAAGNLLPGVRAVLRDTVDQAGAAASQGDYAGAAGNVIRGVAAMPIAAVAPAANLLEPIGRFASTLLTGAPNAAGGSGPISAAAAATPPMPAPTTPAKPGAPTAANPTDTRLAGGAPAGAPTSVADVKRYVDPNGQVLFTNAGPLPEGGAPSASANAAADALTAKSYGESLAINARGEQQGGPVSAIVGTQAVAERDARNARFSEEVLRGRGGKANLQSADAMAKTRTDAATAAARETAETGRNATRETAATQRTAATVAGNLQQEQLRSAGSAELRAAQTAEAKARTAGVVQQIAAQKAYTDALATGDAAAIDRAEQALRAVTAKLENDQVKVVPLPAGVDPVTGAARGAGAIVVDRKGNVKIVTPDEAKGTASAPKYETGKVYQDAKGNKAKWDGQKFVPA